MHDHPAVTWADPLEMGMGLIVTNPLGGPMDYEHVFRRQRTPDGELAWLPVRMAEAGADPVDPGEYLILSGDPEVKLTPVRRVTVKAPRAPKPKVAAA